MQLEHIILFSKVANEKSISKAASTNHISQPALSQQMQRLEEEVGQKLFERSNKGIELTQAGLIMQKYADQMIKIYSHFQEDIRNMANNRHTIRILATSVAAEYALPCSLFKVQQRFPDCSFSLNAAHSKEITHSVSEGSADIGFIIGKTNETGLVCALAFSDKIYLTSKTSYPIDASITIEELYKHPLLMLNQTYSSYQLISSYMQSHGVKIEKLNTTHMESTEAIKSAVLSEHTLAFLPYMAVKKELYQKHLKVIALEDFDIDCNIYSIHRTRSAINSAETYAITMYFINTVNKSIC